MSTVDFHSLLNLMPAIARGRLSILLRGPHGIGKSQVCYLAAQQMTEWLPEVKEEFGEDYEYEVIERRASQMPDAGDLMGIPFRDGDVARFASMEWYDIACKKPVILFFDEVDRALKDVRQAFFELGDSRKLAGKKLHPYTIIFGAVNSGPHDNNTYHVGEMDPAELSRWVTFDVSPSVKDFIKYAKDPTLRKDIMGNKIGPFHPALVDFLKENNQYIEHKDQFEPNKVYPCRRSWDRLDATLKHAPFLQEALESKSFNNSLFAMAQAFVGDEQATAFADFIKNYEKNVSLKDIIEDGKIDLVSELDNNQIMNLVEKFLDSKYITQNLTASRNKKKLDNLCAFLVKIPDEIAVHCWENTVRKNNKNGTEGVYFNTIELDGETISMQKYISSILGADKERKEKKSA